MPEAEPNSSAHSYEVLGKLAEGGTTEIFLARAKGVGAVERVVVLKRLKRAVTSHVDLVKLFLEEARLAAQLQHPNIAQVFEVGKLGGSFFYAMEFVNGETLQSLTHHARGKKIQIPVRAVLTIASALAAGLHHAHDRKGSDGQPLGIVHGDVSPTNTLVSQEGIVKLVDFGVAKAGAIKAKVSPYSSPEQCRGDAIDRRSDLFALGIVLWELLTLDPLYQRANDDDIKEAIEHEEPVKPSTMRYDVPPELDAMVLRLLAKDPAQRFQDADEVLAAIESLAQKLSILLSTADLSRMMRLWFGTKSEPTSDAAAPDTDAPLLVSSEAIPADLATTHTLIDDQLDSVRSAAAFITARATARSGNTTGRQDKSTVPPELMDNPNENFEQIRDRILARARQKKETKQNQLGSASAVPSLDLNHLTSHAVAARPSSPTAPFAGAPVNAAASPTAGAAVNAAASPTAGGAVNAAASPTAGGAVNAAASPTAGAQLAVLPLISRPATAADDRHSRTTALPPLAMNDRHTRTTAQAPIAVIEEAVRLAGIADPVEINGVNGHASTDAAPATPDEPDKVVVDEELSGSRSASGELGNKGTSGVISRHEAKVSISAEMAIPVEPREAPPAGANVATAETNGVTATATAAAAAATEAASSTAADAGLRAGSKTPREEAQAVREEAKAAKDQAKADREETKREGQAAAREEAKVARDDAKAARDHAKGERDDAKAARRRDREAIDNTERVRATARASTADIAAPRGRPTWLLPVVGAAALLLIFLVVMKLRGGDQPPRASAQPPQAQQVKEPAANPAGTPLINDQAAKDQAAQDQAAKDQAAKDQAAKDQAAKDQAAKDQAVKDQAAKDQAAKDQAAKDQAAKDQAAKDQAAKDQAAKDQAAKDQAAQDQAAKDQAAKKNLVVKKDPVVKKEPETKKGIEELFAAGDFAKTNTACTKEIVFTAQKLQMCAEAACQTKSSALAKRWINAISKGSRAALVEKCKSLGVELDAPPPAAAPPAAGPPASAPAPTPTAPAAPPPPAASTP